MINNYINEIEKKIKFIFGKHLGYNSAFIENKDYLLTFLFFKYISDLNEYDSHKIKIPKEASYQFIYEKRDNENLGELLNTALKIIDKDAYPNELRGLFKGIDYTSERVFGHVEQQNKILKSLINEFKHIKLDPKHIDTRSMGRIYRRLIENFHIFNVKKAEFAPTPESISSLVAQLVQPESGDKIHDPTAGSGSLLIRVAEEVKGEDFSLYAQEKNRNLYVLLKMNAIINGMDKNLEDVECGDILTNPLILNNNQLMKFNVVVAHPPFSMKVDEYELYNKDFYKRFERGIPPASKADYAFISHLVSVMDDKNGRAAIILPHGVLFRGGNEEIIRKALIEEDLIDAVIGLPSKLIYGTGIPITIIILKKNRNKGNILFIDASNYFTNKNTTVNELSEEHIHEIVSVYNNYKGKKNYASVADKESIRQNGYNLNISRYVDTFEKESNVDEDKILEKIDILENKIHKTQSELRKYLLEIKDLNF
ncbi:N-6 DNA methylase [Priestia aryabhattai]|uniref:N-6 DNA methylase n=1 Tax=Priestia aryabhattai TaxID=412384 RepID=UPI0023B0776E|nr:N-6 DNA methylase [Priestia aryabhattai]MDE8676559.1 N-6 DNA methylase [Priestia aryabhattai]